MHPIDQHVGRRVRLARQLSGISQVVLASRLNISFQQVQKYESGTNRVSASRLYEIANVLEVPIIYFFQGYLDPNEENVDASKGQTLSLNRDEARILNAYRGIGDADARHNLLKLIEAISDRADA